MTNPDNVGWQKPLIPRLKCLASLLQQLNAQTACQAVNDAIAEIELCRAAPAGGVYAHPGEIEAARRNLERGIGDGLVTVSVKPVPGYVALNSAPAGGECQHEWQPDAAIAAMRQEGGTP